jgi:hypothetical protein
MDISDGTGMSYESCTSSPDARTEIISPDAPVIGFNERRVLGLDEILLFA